MLSFQNFSASAQTVDGLRTGNLPLEAINTLAGGGSLLIRGPENELMSYQLSGAGLTEISLADLAAYKAQGRNYPARWLYKINAKWNGASNTYAVYVFALDASVLSPTGFYIDSQNICKPIADINTNNATYSTVAQIAQNAIPFGPIEATGVSGELFHLPVGTKSVRAIQVFDINPQAGQYPVVCLTANMYVINTAVSPPTLSIKSPYGLSAGDIIEGIAFLIDSESGGGGSPVAPNAPTNPQTDDAANAFTYKPGSFGVVKPDAPENGATDSQNHTYTYKPGE